jgi:hypothetical protein
MSVPARVGLFLGGLAIVFAAAFAIGDAIDPDGPDEATSAHSGGDDHASASTQAGEPVRIVVEDRRFEPGATETLAFRVLDRDGNAVEDFEVEHERAMHVIAVRRDLTGYQHVHPRRTGDGWEVDVAFPEAGPHRVFADFSSGGSSYTLGSDVEVSGEYASQRLLDPSTIATAGGGYEVTVAERGSERGYSVSKDGRAAHGEHGHDH